jgi:serine protease Do
MARSISDTLLAGKKVVRGWLGVRIQDLSEEMAEEFGARGRDGVLIGDVEEGSPASKAGVLRGDIVVGLDGHAVSDTAAFRNQIAAGGEGKKVQLSILRDGKEKKLDVTLGRLPEAEEVAVAGGGEAGEAGSGLLSGLQVKPLDARMRERLDLPESSQGLLITDVDGGSPAARVDLRPGDVILDCNKKPVGSVDELRKAAQGSGGRVLLRVRRGDASIYVLMTK